MSGIAAILDLKGTTALSSEIERVGNVLKPYGPDRQKNLVQRRMAFAACLHFLTPEDDLERQPLLMANRFVVLFDGRIDNREEVAEALNISAKELRVMADSVLAWRLFERWGEDGFARICGVFAIIVGDLREGI